MQNFLLMVLGTFIGIGVDELLTPLFCKNKKYNIEQEKLASYKEGYKKGFDDGYELQKTHLK